MGLRVACIFSRFVLANRGPVAHRGDTDAFSDVPRRRGPAIAQDPEDHKSEPLDVSREGVDTVNKRAKHPPLTLGPCPF